MKKLLFTLLITITFSFMAALGQVIYTDLIPDSTVSATMQEVEKGYFVDFDNNGNYEFEIRHFNPEPGQESVEIHRNFSGTQEVLINSEGHAKVLSENDVIGPNSSQWGLDQYGILNDPWYGDGDKYFGFRFKISGQWHYAWARVSIPSDHLSVTIKDFAYESTPNASIVSGTISDVNYSEILTHDLNIYPNPVINKAILEFSLQNAGNINISMYNSLGEIVQNLTKDYYEAGFHKLEIQTGNLPTGVYFLKIDNEIKILFKNN